MLLTITNIGNYFLGNKISPIFIISFVILSYVLIFRTYFENILNNVIMSYSLLILIIMDIICIIYLYFSKYNNVEDKKDKKHKDKKHKDKKHKDKKHKDKKPIHENIEIPENNINNTIKTYKTDDLETIKTYNTL